MKYSFVIPCYKSKDTIVSVIEEISVAMNEKKENSFEVICVNDFPFDETFDLLKELVKQYSFLKVVNLSKNFGQHAALLAGYNEALGELVVSMDDDGQTPASEVFKLIEKLNEGYDVVFARYESKKHSAFRNFGSRVNDWMAEALIGKPKGLYISSYFVAKKYIIKEMVKYKYSFPYVSGLVLRTTAFISNADVDHRERTVGDSNYSFRKLISLWLNGFTAFSVKPLRISVILGIITALFGFLLTLYSLINFILNPLVPTGWTSTVAVVSIIGGVILMVLGMIGEYVGRIYLAINDTPQFVVKEKYTHDKD